MFQRFNSEFETETENASDRKRETKIEMLEYNELEEPPIDVKTELVVGHTQ